MKSVLCGNQYCDNEIAVVDKICGKFSTALDGNCDYINYAIPKAVYSIFLTFEFKSCPQSIANVLSDEEQVLIDLNNSELVFGSWDHLDIACTPLYGQAMSNFVFSMIQSWLATFGKESELAPESSKVEGPKFQSVQLNLLGNKLQVDFQIGMFLQSHQSDMLDWYPESLVDSLIEESHVWTHEGVNIKLLSAETN